MPGAKSIVPTATYVAHAESLGQIGNLAMADSLVKAANLAKAEIFGLAIDIDGIVGPFGILCCVGVGVVRGQSGRSRRVVRRRRGAGGDVDVATGVNMRQPRGDVRDAGLALTGRSRIGLAYRG